MIHECVETDVPQQDQKRISIERHASKVSQKLASKRTIDYLNTIMEAPNENLQIDQSVILAEALWQQNKGAIFRYSLLFLVHYLAVTVYICFGLGNEVLALIVGGLSVIMLLFEVRQMKNDPFYFREFWNWMDLMGNLTILGHVAETAQLGTGSLKSGPSKVLLIIGTSSVCIRAVFQLRQFTNFRVLLEMLRSTISDMVYFLALLLFMILACTLLQRVVEVQKPH